MSSLNALEILAIWLFAPTAVVCVIALVLSALRIKPPKHKPGQPSWFKERDW
jgi:hypothetical protein